MAHEAWNIPYPPLTDGGRALDFEVVAAPPSGLLGDGRLRPLSALSPWGIKSRQGLADQPSSRRLPRAGPRSEGSIL